MPPPLCQRLPRRLNEARSWASDPLRRWTFGGRPAPAMLSQAWISTLPRCMSRTANLVWLAKPHMSVVMVLAAGSPEWSGGTIAPAIEIEGVDLCIERSTKRTKSKWTLRVVIAADDIYLLYNDGAPGGSLLSPIRFLSMVIEQIPNYRIMTVPAVAGIAMCMRWHSRNIRVFLKLDEGI